MAQNEMGTLRGMPLCVRSMEGCAQHGRELMGCKSPVGEPNWTHESNTTTSRRRVRNRLAAIPEGLTREGWSGGSLSANVRDDEQKPHRRPGGSRQAGTRQQSPSVRRLS